MAKSGRLQQLDGITRALFQEVINLSGTVRYLAVRDRIRVVDPRKLGQADLTKAGKEYGVVHFDLLESIWQPLLAEDQERLDALVEGIAMAREEAAAADAAAQAEDAEEIPPAEVVL